MGLQGMGQRLTNCWGNIIKSKISSQPGKSYHKVVEKEDKKHLLKLAIYML